MKHLLASISSLVIMAAVVVFAVPEVLDEPVLLAVVVVATLFAISAPLIPRLLSSVRGKKAIWSTDDARFLMIRRDGNGSLTDCIIAGRAGLDEYGRHQWGVRRIRIEDGEPGVVWTRVTGWKTSTAPAMMDGLIIAGRPQWQGLMAIEPDTGEVAWEVPTEEPLNQHQTPLLRAGLLHVVEDETGRWLDIRPVSGEIIDEGQYSTDSEWEAVRERHDPIVPASLLASRIQLGDTILSLESPMMRRNDEEAFKVERVEDYHDPDIARPDLPSAPLDSDEIYRATMSLPTIDTANSLGMYGDDLLVLESKEGYGGKRTVAFVVVSWPELDEVARFSIDRPGITDGMTGPSIDDCYEVDGLLVVVVDGLEDTQGRSYGEEGWIIDPETWTRVCWLPETCDDDEDEFAEIIVYDRSDAEVGRLVL